MKTTKVLLLLTCLPLLSFAKWQVNEAYLQAGTNDSVKLHLTAYSDGVYKENSFLLLYHKTYVVGDTLIIRPYYFESIIGSGIKKPTTKVNTINLGIVSDGIKHICVRPYDIVEIDTNAYKPVPNLPNYCMAASTVSIKETEKIPTISIYPNPVSSIIKITSSSKVNELTIYSLIGQTIKQINNPNTSIDIMHIPSGIYMIKIETDKGTLYKRFSKN